MTFTVGIMIAIGVILSIASFFISEKLFKKEDNVNLDLFTIDENYEFSERELRIIKRKIEDVIANHAKDIIYETNDSLSNMANEKTMALGDYAVTVCEEIERNHKEVMFLYSMLDDKQKEIMNTVKSVDGLQRGIVNTAATVDDAKRQVTNTVKALYEANKSVKETISEAQRNITVLTELSKETKTIISKLQDKTLSGAEQQVQVKKNKVNEREAADSPSKDVKAPVRQKAAESIEEFAEETEAIVDERELAALASDLDSLTIPDIDGGMDIKDSALETVYEPEQEDFGYDDALEEEFKENANSNDIILDMYRGGNNVIEIAKQLGLGVGEVKLVIDLYQGEQ
ncbi:MAG: hypothetical protein K2K56_08250 [Lachnospiraceae bacterium]|nr:hypothetical protein [Lachnospiraceae bacterium]